MKTSLALASRKYGLLASMFLLVSGLLSSCSPAENTETPDPVRPVKLIEIRSSTNEIHINLPAVIEATETADVTFLVGGSLDEFTVRASQEVTKGEVIARLNQRDYKNAVEQAQAQYDSAESEFQRAERLIVAEAISRSVYEQRRSARDVARAALDTARKSLEDTTLRSPFDGVIAQLHVDQYQVVSPQQPIVTIQTTGAAEAVVQAPSKLVAFSERFTPVNSEIVLDVAPDESVPAEFYSASAQADPMTQTFTLNFTFTPPEDLLILPGMTGSLRATLLLADADNTAAEQITVPLGAVLSDGDKEYVWVVDTDTMTVSKRAVELNEGVGENLIVRTGLSSGEVIAGAGASYLFEGMQVRAYEG